MKEEVEEEGGAGGVGAGGGKEVRGDGMEGEGRLG